MPSTTLTLNKPITQTPKPQARQVTELPLERDSVGFFEDDQRSEPAIQEIAPPKADQPFRGEISFVHYTPNIEEINRDSTVVFPPLATIEKTVNIIANAAESVGKIAPDVTDSMKDLIWGQIVGREKKAPQKDDPNEIEKQVKKAEIIFQNNKGQEISRATQNVTQKRLMEAIMGGDAQIASMSEDDRNRKLGLQEGYKSNAPLSEYHKAELRRILVAEKLAAKAAKNQQSRAETKGASQQVVIMDAALEGGTGGAKKNISATGGAVG